jgi:hypothetical protein
MVNETAVQAEPESGPTGASQRDVVARQIDLLEPVAFLKVAKTVALLFPVGKVRVYEIRDPPFGT